MVVVAMATGLVILLLNFCGGLGLWWVLTSWLGFPPYAAGALLVLLLVAEVCFLGFVMFEWEPPGWVDPK